jgi:hypothetical protein
VVSGVLDQSGAALAGAAAGDDLAMAAAPPSGSGSSSFALRVRYVGPGRNVDAPDARRLWVSELAVAYALSEVLGLFARAPLLMRESEHGDKRVGQGDAVLGGVALWPLAAESRHRLGGSFELSVPLGNAHHGFGAGHPLGRALAQYAVRWTRFSLSANAGVAFAAASDETLAIDSALGASYALSLVSPFIALHGRHFLLEGRSLFAAGGRERYDAGDTMLTLVPGVSLRASSALSFGVAALVPLTAWQSFGLSVELAYRQAGAAGRSMQH